MTLDAELEKIGWDFNKKYDSKISGLGGQLSQNVYREDGNIIIKAMVMCSDLPKKKQEKIKSRINNRFKKYSVQVEYI